MTSEGGKLRLAIMIPRASSTTRIVTVESCTIPNEKTLPVHLTDHLCVEHIAD